jgi:hypothetical protein
VGAKNNPFNHVKKVIQLCTFHYGQNDKGVKDMVLLECLVNSPQVAP